MRATRQHDGLHTKAAATAMSTLTVLTMPAILSTLSLGLAMFAGGCGGSDSPASAQTRKGKPATAPTTRKAAPRPAATPASAPASINPAEAIGEYFLGVYRARKQAETLADKIAMGVLGKDLTMYAAAHDGLFPPTLAELGRRDLLHAPGPDGQPYQYVPGQRDSSPRTNILAYEKQPVHNGKLLALRVSGTVDLLAPADLEKALAQTKKKLK
jgi:hypothetical protein